LANAPAWHLLQAFAKRGSVDNSPIQLGQIGWPGGAQKFAGGLHNLLEAGISGVTKSKEIAKQRASDSAPVAVA
jgi:hypothetical protein